MQDLETRKATLRRLLSESYDGNVRMWMHPSERGLLRKLFERHGVGILRRCSPINRLRFVFIIELRWLNDVPWSLQQLSVICGVTSYRVRQLEQKLRRHLLRSLDYDEFVELQGTALLAKLKWTLRGELFDAYRKRMSAEGKQIVELHY